MRRTYSITPAGYVFLGITGFILIAAVNSQTNLLFFAFGLMLGGVICPFILTTLTLARLDIKRIMTNHAVAGEPSDLKYQLTNKKRFWPCFALRIDEVQPIALTESPTAYALHVGPRQSTILLSRLIAARRGIVQLDPIRVTTAFPFGFLTHSILLHRPELLYVYPRIGVLNRHLALRTRESVESGTMTSNLRGGNDEFYGIREYRAGDNIRSIHWRSTARTGQLTIREMAANAPPQLIVVLNLRKWPELPDGHDQCERAIELAASLLCYGYIENFAVGLGIAGLESQLPPIPQMGRESRARLLHQLAVLSPDSLRPAAPFPMPNRLIGRAEWIIVSLRQSDPYRDLLPPFAGGGANHTLLALDNPEAPNWLNFVSAQSTLRILRETQSPRPLTLPYKAGDGIAGICSHTSPADRSIGFHT